MEPGKVWLIFEKVFSWESTVFDNVLKQRTEAVAQGCFFKKVLLEKIALGKIHRKTPVTEPLF